MFYDLCFPLCFSYSHIIFKFLCWPNHLSCCHVCSSRWRSRMGWRNESSWVYLPLRVVCAPNFFPCMTFHQFSLLSPFHRLYAMAVLHRFLTSACLSLSVFSLVYFMLLKLVVCLFIDFLFFLSIHFYYQNKIGECKSDGECGDGRVGWWWWVGVRQDQLIQYMNKERISLSNIWIKRGLAYPIYE